MLPGWRAETLGTWCILAADHAHYTHSLDFVQLALSRKEFGAAVVVSDPIRRLAIDLRKEAYDCKSAALSMRGSSGRCIADRLA